MPAEVKNLITVICDNEACRQSIFWVENKPEEIPDNVFRILILQYFNQQKLVFCSRHCLLKFLNDKFVPLKSPREQAAEQAAQAPTAPVVESVPASETAVEQAVLAPPSPNPPTVPEAPVPDAPKVVAFPGEVIGEDKPEALVAVKPKRGRPRKVAVVEPPVPTTTESPQQAN